MLKTYEDAIWFQHSEETDEQYRFFLRYYLPLKAKRSRTIIGSYRRYLIDDRGYTKEDADSISKYGSRYSHWAAGKDATGNVIAGLATWEERTQAYWDWMFEDELNQISERRTSVIEVEHEHASVMLKQWDSLFQSFLSFAAMERKALKEADAEYNPASHLGQLKNFIRSREELATFIRRSVGMTDTVKEDLFAKAIGNEKIHIEWVEPEAKKYEEDELDIELQALGEEEFEALLDRLSQ